MPAVMVTLVQATFVLATFVHSTNIAPVTDPYFWEPQFFWIPFFLTNLKVCQKKLLNKYGPKIFVQKNFQKKL